MSPYTALAGILIIVAIVLVWPHYRRILQGFQVSSNKIVVFTLTRNAGFFSTFFFLCQSYIYAKKHGYPFYIDHSNWQYTVDKGWHDYFTTLDILPPGLAESSHIIHMSHFHTVPDVYTVSDYEMAIHTLFKPHPHLEKRAQLAMPSQPYTGLYIRRGDKVAEGTKEMELLSIKTILNTTDIINDGRTIFVQTDDYKVVEEVRALLPSCTVQTLTPPVNHGSHAAAICAFTPAERRIHTEELITSTLILMNASKVWSDIRSNVGRFHKLMNWEKVSLYPKETEATQASPIQPFFTM